MRREYGRGVFVEIKKRETSWSFRWITPDSDSDCRFSSSDTKSEFESDVDNETNSVVIMAAK